MRIYQEHLDALSTAILTADLQAGRARVAIPYFIQTLDISIVVKTEEEFEKTFLAVSASMRAEGVTEQIRIAQNANFIAPDEIIGTHVTHRMRRATRLIAPYPSRIRLVSDAGNTWRETHSSNALYTRAGHIALLVSAHDMSSPPPFYYAPERNPE